MTFFLIKQIDPSEQRVDDRKGNFDETKKKKKIRKKKEQRLNKNWL